MAMATAAPGNLASEFEGRPYMRAVWWLSLLGPFFLLSYGLTNWLTSLRANVPAVAFGWESSIPFLAWTIIPYWSTDFLYVGSIFICRTRQELDTHASRLLAAQIISVCAFLLFPLRFSFERPETHGFFRLMFDALGSFDRPFNQAPSLHLSLTTILWARFSAHLKGVPLWLMRGWLALAGLATLTTYQHHFIDVPAGILVGLISIGLFPSRQLEKAKHRLLARAAQKRVHEFAGTYRAATARERWPDDARRIRLSSAYLLVSLFLAAKAFSWPILLWPATALFIVAAAYWTGRPGLLGKRHPLMRLLLAPYIFGAWLNSRLQTLGEPPAQEIAAGVWIGRWPSRSELNAHGIASVVDLTAELPAVPSGIRYRSVPILDLTIPTREQLDASVEAIGAFETHRPTLVCCALGYSRSAAAIAAWLVVSGHDDTMDAAIATIRERRPRIALSAAHESRLREWADRQL
jgi:protein-tyrosine phosphatase/membrane-associated phospholipid phosphatase